MEGNAQSPNIIAQEVSLIAGGTGDYQGQVTFANTNNATTGDTMTLPMGSNWSSFGFANGDSIYVAGAINSPDTGVFTIATVVNNVLTLTPNDSYVLAPETQPDVTVGDGMIGLLNAAVSLSDVPIFVATTANGGIYLETGAAVNSTAYFVLAGGMNGMTNNVSVTSQANFLTIENIIATGNAAVAMNGGSLVEYGAENITGQNVSLTSPYDIGTASSPFLTNAKSGLTVAATATSPSSATIDVDNYSPLTSIGVSTDDGSVTIQSGAGSLSFTNNVLSETGNAVVTLTNTDNQDGSAGDVIISGRVYVSGISAGIGDNGTAGAGQILSEANATIDGIGGTVILSAGSGIGSPGTSVDIKDLAALLATTTTGGIYIQNTSATRDDPERLCVEREHRCDVVGGDRFEQREQRHAGERLHDGYSNTRRDGRRHCGGESLFCVCQHAHADGNRRDRHIQQPRGNLRARHSDFDGVRWRRPVPCQ